MNDLAEAALHYAAMGWPVFPVHGFVNGACTCGNPNCESPAKHPRTPNGFKDATTDVNTINAWWVRWPDANVAVALGNGVGIVVDIDPRNGGDASFEKMIEEHAPLPRGPVARTGGGGEHRWLAHPGGTVPPSHGFLPGLDLQGDGSYVLLPPSRHKSGHSYEWVVPPETKLSMPPPWLLELADTAGPRGGPQKFTLDPKAKIPHGSHHSFIVSTSASLAARMKGAEPNTIYAAIRSIIEGALDDAPKHTLEIDEAVRSAISKFGASPDVPPPPPPLAGSPPTVHHEDDAPPPEPPRPLFIDNEPDRAAFVEWVMECHKFATMADSEELLMRKGWIYNGHSIPRIKHLVESKFRTRDKGTRTTTERFRNEVVASIKSRTYTDRALFNPIGWLRVDNGFLDLRLPSTPNFVPDGTDLSSIETPLLFTRQQPVQFDETAQCQKFLTFLNEVLPDEADQRTVQEMFGYCLIGGNGLKLAFFWVGPHDTGKSTLLEVLRGILGSENTSTIALQSLADNRFASASLWGKLANIYTDLSPKLIKDAGLFKMLTGGSDRVPAEKKFQMPFDFVNPAKLIFSANALPAVPWGDDAFFRRWVVTEFSHQIPMDRQIQRYETVLLKEEAPGILNWMLEGLDRLTARAHFDMTGSPGETRDMWRRLSDSLAWFVEDMLVKDRENEIPKQELFTRYQEFCEEHGVEIRRIEEVGKELPHLVVGMHQTVGKTKERKSIRVWKGARWKSDLAMLPSNSQSTLETPLGANLSTMSTRSTPISGITPTREGRSTIPEAPVDSVDAVDSDPEDLFGPKGTRADRSRVANTATIMPEDGIPPAPSPPTETPPVAPPPPPDVNQVDAAESAAYKMLDSVGATGVSQDRIVEALEEAGYSETVAGATLGRILGDGRVTMSGGFVFLKPEVPGSDDESNYVPGPGDPKYDRPLGRRHYQCAECVTKPPKQHDCTGCPTCLGVEKNREKARARRENEERDAARPGDEPTQ